MARGNVVRKEKASALREFALSSHQLLSATNPRESMHALVARLPERRVHGAD